MDIELEVTLNPTLTSELYGLIGRGISSAVVDANGHLVITMTDGATIDLGNVKGAKGDTGEKGETGDTGATGPQGNPGTNGTDGVDGYSPTVSGNKVGKVTTLVITDKNGQHTYTINDGADGSGTGDMIKETYDPANGARQVAFLDEIPTNAEKASWNAKYDKPSGGIPDSDIASAATWNEKQSQHSSTTATLTTAGWSNSAQTVNVTGVTASNSVIVAPAPASATDYGDAGIICTTQASGTLTFTCESTPTSNITVNVLILD